MIGGTHEDLKNQHRQISEALAADQSENASLKEKMKKVSAEIESLKPTLEKIRSDARHQKGLVAINKKQLATQETEREKIRGDVDGARDDLTQANQELEQSHRDLASQPRAPPVSSPAPAVTSPAPSTTSMNPFFRRPSNPPPADRGPVTSLHHSHRLRLHHLIIMLLTVSSDLLQPLRHRHHLHLSRANRHKMRRQLAQQTAQLYLHHLNHL